MRKTSISNCTAVDEINNIVSVRSLFSASSRIPGTGIALQVICYGLTSCRDNNPRFSAALRSTLFPMTIFVRLKFRIPVEGHSRNMSPKRQVFLYLMASLLCGSHSGLVRFPTWSDRITHTDSIESMYLIATKVSIWINA